LRQKAINVLILSSDSDFSSLFLANGAGGLSRVVGLTRSEAPDDLKLGQLKSFNPFLRFSSSVSYNSANELAS